MPGEFNKEMKFYDSAEQCKNFVMISGLLAGLLALSTIIVSIKNKGRPNSFQTITLLSFLKTCGLASKLQHSGRKSLDDFSSSGYAGRAVVQ